MTKITHQIYTHMECIKKFQKFVDADFRSKTISFELSPARGTIKAYYGEAVGHFIVAPRRAYWITESNGVLGTKDHPRRRWGRALGKAVLPRDWILTKASTI